MRSPRILADAGTDGVYHCMSRVVGASHLLNEFYKDLLVALLEKLAAFCEVQIITFCMMSNHFHILVRVPPRRNVSLTTDAELLEKILSFYGKTSKVYVIAESSVRDGLPIPEKIRSPLLSRTRNLSAFLQEFKQRFARVYNSRNDRSGYFWAERFKSVLIEDCPKAIQTVAAYIDLNPVRAGMVQDPADYPFSGYSAALGGNAKARVGLMSFLSSRVWELAAREYREMLFVTAGHSGSSDKVALDPTTIRAEIARGALVTKAQVLRLHIRHMTDGIVLGSKSFVDATWEKHRAYFGKRRASGARPIRGAPLPDLMAIRNLRKDAIV